MKFGKFHSASVIILPLFQSFYKTRLDLNGAIELGGDRVKEMRRRRIERLQSRIMMS